MCTDSEDVTVYIGKVKHRVQTELFTLVRTSTDKGGTGSQPLVYEEKSEADMSSVVDLKTKEEKDAELDKRIEALRKKNEALVKRYQEIEEDKKKAEQEGIAVTTPRKPRPHEPEPDRRKGEKENFTVTVDLSKPTGEKRIVNDWKHGTPRGRKTTGSGRVSRGGHRGGGRQERRDWEPRTPRDGEPGESGGQGRRGGRRGRGGEGGGGGTPGGMDRKSKEWEEKRRQNIEKMNEEMERIAEYERGQRPDGDKPIRNFLDDPRRSGPAPDTDRKEGSRRHVRNWGGLDFDNVKTGAELEKEWTSRRPGPKSSVDMTMSMTGRERAEYLRWKKEREQIDEERLARHRNATGQWRREWDAQKTENMFKEDPCAAAEGVTSEQGGSRRDDSKRPPKAPTFGDFLSQGRGQGPRGDRSRGKGRGQKQSYSMHDNRWEGEKEEEEKEKEDLTKKEEKASKKEKEEEKPKPPAAQKVEEKSKDGEDDDDEWEDASDEEDDVEEGSDSEHESAADEKKDSGKEKRDKSKDSSPTSPAARSRPTSAGSPKEQRTPRPKVHIPPPASAQESSEGGKPLSPFSPFDGHQPVSDWGEAMEMQSPRSSMGGESPLKPPSIEASPPQKQEQQEEETESQAVSSSEPAEPQKEEHTEDSSPPTEAEAQQSLILSEPESVPSDPPAALLSHPTPPEVSDCEPSAFSVPVPSEVCEAPVTMDQDPPALSKPQDDLDTPPSPTIAELEQSCSAAAAGGEDGDVAPAETDAETDAAPTADTEEPSEQPSSG
ncbi:hypothetical protein Q5P01_009589 [Channa striata]|uniref:Coiled-coil domain-containing protein 9 n=1 Tax=Channa striata TaxID=64152 RepID=A0AA88N0Q8_CHASR|nr:hypothetical protein Q5P01_009589 [Channa striata]